MKAFMKPGRVYRRQDFKGTSTAVDRDLKILVSRGEIRKLAWGLYCREENPRPQELVRAFLKTEDFSLVPGQGHHLVYNHKRTGDFRLGRERFRFRIIRDYSRTPHHDRMPLRVLDREDERADLEFWLAKPPAERIAAVEFLREQHYALSGFKSLPRLAHSIRLGRR
jgi:hypothetical protein